MRNRRGFSLIETMIAVMALSFIVMVFGAVVPTATRMRHKAENITRATMLAHQKLEQLRGVGYTNLTPANLLAAGMIDATPDTSPYSITGVSGLASELPDGSGTLTITDEATDLKRARVDITWGGIITQGNSVALVTFIANREDLVE
jgi:prepilin-type N-terminal cleavage/methylation domain-containing protein